MVKADSSTARRDAKAGQIGTCRRPQSTAFALLAPTGFIDVDDWFSLECGVQCCINREECGTHAPTTANHARQTNREVGNIGKQVSNCAVGKVKGAVKMAAQRSNARTIPSCRIRRSGCNNTSGTGGTTHGKLLIIGDKWSEQRQLPDGRDHYRGSIGQVLGQSGQAVRAVGGSARDDLIGLAPLTSAALMTNLSTGFAATRHLLRTRRCRRWVRRGWFAGVVRGQIEPLFKVKNALGQCTELLGL